MNFTSSSNKERSHQRNICFGPNFLNMMFVWAEFVINRLFSLFDVQVSYIRLIFTIYHPMINLMAYYYNNHLCIDLVISNYCQSFFFQVYILFKFLNDQKESKHWWSYSKNSLHKIGLIKIAFMFGSKFFIL